MVHLRGTKKLPTPYTYRRKHVRLEAYKLYLPMNLYNTRTRQKEHFHPMNGTHVGLYTCGPTVYNYAHIGNLRTYVFEDVLIRGLKYNGLEVNHVMNITDVGHLTDDGDQGEDKMEKGAAREGKSAWDIAAYYTTAFQEDMTDLNILPPTTWCKATDHIQEQIDQVQTLIDTGMTYQTSDGIYFDTSKLDDYGALAQLDKQALQAGARVDMGEKKHPTDFALWKFTPEGETRQMEWDAFGKKGFPGWHIECSAMSMKYLGEQFDIHCGGIDHIPVHHTNEIAQAEAATGKKPWVNIWMHGEFLLINDGRMGKSQGNFITLRTLKEKGYDPLAYRYFLLQAHYRKQLNFTWEALDAAAEGLKNLKQKIQQIDPDVQANHGLEKQFLDAINDDLNTAEAIALIWKGLKEKTISMQTIVAFDKVLGLNLHVVQDETPVEIPADVQELLTMRAESRDEKDWAKSDALRDEIARKGFIVKDTDSGQEITSSDHK